MSATSAHRNRILGLLIVVACAPSIGALSALWLSPGGLGNGRAAGIALLALDGGDRRAVRDGLVLGLGRWGASR